MRTSEIHMGHENFLRKKSTTLFSHLAGLPPSLSPAPQKRVSPFRTQLSQAARWGLTQNLGLWPGEAGTQGQGRQLGGPSSFKSLDLGKLPFRVAQIQGWLDSAVRTGPTSEIRSSSLDSVIKLKCTDLQSRSGTPPAHTANLWPCAQMLCPASETASSQEGRNQASNPRHPPICAEEPSAL